MQVKSSRNINDFESIKIAIGKLAVVYKKYLNDDPVQHAIEDYNAGDDYTTEITAIYSELLKLLSIDNLIKGNEACA